MTDDKKSHPDISLMSDASGTWGVVLSLTHSGSSYVATDPLRLTHNN